MEFESFDSPTGDADNTNISQFGFNNAADSIAQACLWIEHRTQFVFKSVYLVLFIQLPGI